MVVVYHERQEAALCGQHCLNNLLQGPYFTEVGLADIALELDRRERELMLADGYTAEARRFMSEASGNVADDGNFSIQVLKEALRRSHSLHLEDTRNASFRDAVLSPENEQGFVLNRHSHWYCVRKLEGGWWRLNSTEENPERLSEFALSAYLSNLLQDSWSIFVVRGSLPPPMPRDPGIAPADNWVDSNRPRRSEFDPAAFANAAAPEPPKFQAFSGTGQKLGGGGDAGGSGGGGAAAHSALDEDAQLALALALSQEVAASKRLEAQLPPEPPTGGARVQIRLPDGAKVTRRFPSDAPLQVLLNYVCVELAAKGGQYNMRSSRWQLTCQYPELKLVFSANAAGSGDLSQTMQQVGLAPSANLYVAAVVE